MDDEIIQEEVQEESRTRTEFLDNRMENATCPLCEAKMDIIRREQVSWGEFGFFQCMECGCIVDVCNMVDKPSLFSMFIRDLGSGVFASLRQGIVETSQFPAMPLEFSKAAREQSKAQQDIADDNRRVKCQNIECSKMFIRAPSAKSMLTLEYCPSCRKSDEIRDYCAACAVAEKNEAKAAKLQAKKNAEKAAKAARTRARNAKKKEKDSGKST